MVNNFFIHKILEEQALYNPNSYAIKYKNAQLTYSELNKISNNLAHYLKKQFNPKKEESILLFLDHNEKIIVSLFAVLKAGCAYVPLNPSDLDNRIKYIINDTKAKIIITNKKYKSKLEKISDYASLNIIAIDDEDIKSKLLLENDYNIECSINDTNLAYIIYTSGSTGMPKGVMVEHPTVTNCATEAIKTFNFTKNDKHLLVLDYIFSLSYTSIWGSLLVGGELHLVDKDDVFNPAIITSYIKDNKISVMKTTPLYWKSLEDYSASNSISIADHKIKIILGGERIGNEVFELISKHQDNFYEFYNHYGSTEVPGCIISKLNEKESNKKDKIGTPIKNIECYILDEDLKLKKEGEIGELCISGIGVARGYLNLPELTAKKFINNPYDIGKKLFRTGDLARGLGDGSIEYVDRSDFTVKIRGYRIELQAIELLLIKYPGIKQAVVVAKEHESVNYLVGYYVSDHQISNEAILNYLEDNLPFYMVPNALVFLKEFPLTANGKLDRKSLPAPIFDEIKDSYKGPSNDLEVKLTHIWSENLKINYKKISVQEDFFRLGGDSILAIRMFSRINKELNISISASLLFNYRTIEKLAKYLENKINKNDSTRITKAKFVNDSKQILSFAQQRLWFIEKYEEGTNAYNVPMIFKLKSEIKDEILEQCIKSIILRHEILRTVIRQNNDENLYQLILEDINEFRLSYLNISQTDLENKLKEDVNYIFNLEKELPLIATLYKVGKKKYLSIVVHHIAFDGWSIVIFIKELEKFYNYHLNQERQPEDKLNLPELEFQYKDFASWQKNYLKGEKIDHLLTYWKKHLESFEPLTLITDKIRPKKVNYVGSDIYFTIDKATSSGLKAMAKELKVSLYSLLLSGYYILLKVFSNQNDITIGIPTANRHYPGVEHLIGFFVNVLPSRIKIDSEISIEEFILNVANNVIDIQLHQDLPFEKIVDALDIPKDMGMHPIFQVVFIVQSFRNILNESKILSSYNGEDPYKIAKFDITTFIDDSGEEFKGHFNYSVELFNEDTIASFVETYLFILTQIVENKHKLLDYKISELKFVNNDQYNKIVNECSEEKIPYLSNKTITELFEKQAEVYPSNTAISFQSKQLTYQQLNEQANRLAHYLRNKFSVEPNDLIALILERNENIIIAILAVLKAGGAYVPIDPNYPKDRIDYILNDAKPKFVIDDKYLEGLELDNVENSNPKINVNGANLAYVIYTSGTTGNPKGVLQTHGNVCRLFSVTEGIYHFSSSDVWTLFHSYTFDFTVWEIWGALFYGGKLVIPSYETTRDLYAFYDLVLKEKVTILNQTPSAFYQFMDIAINAKDSDNLNLKFVVFGGEALNYIQLKPWFDKFGYSKPTLVNMYGITETTVHTTYKIITKQDIKGKSNIGYRLADLKFYVLDRNLTLTPRGAIGELYVGGNGLAKGYLNRPELTKERFIDNPFTKNTKLYKTGDLVRVLANGSLEYIGRNDFQVKVRGYRIELGEIEKILANFPEVKQAIVSLSETNSDNKHIIAYYVAAKRLDEDKINQYLAEKLPDYMMPTAIIYLDILPLTSNGKIDLKALPKPTFSDFENYMAPSNDVERNMVKIWAEVLKIPQKQIGVNDDFFRLGGDSIISIQLVSRIRKKLKLELNIKDIFRYKTIANIANNLKQNITSESDIKKETTNNRGLYQPENNEIEAVYLANNLQQGFIYHSLVQSEMDDAYHVQLIWQYHTEINLTALERAWQVAQNKFAALRMNFALEDHPLAIIYKQKKLDYRYKDLSDLDDTKQKEVINFIQLQDRQEKYNLEQDILFRIFLIKQKDNLYTCIFSNHHSILDGWSNQLLLNFVHTTYLKIIENQEFSALPYDAFHKVQAYLQNSIEDNYEYWKNYVSKLEDEINLRGLLLPQASSVNLLNYNHVKNSQCQNLVISEDLYIKLKQLTRNEGLTLNSIIEFGWHKILSIYGNASQTIAGVTVSGRNLPVEDIENAVGLFINTLPLIVKHKAEKVIDVIRAIIDDLNEANNHSNQNLAKLQKPGQRLFASIVVYENYPSYKSDELKKLHISKLKAIEKLDYPLSLIAFDTGNELKLEVKYAGELFDKNKISQLFSLLKYLFEQITANPQIKIAELNYLNQQQYNQIVKEWNDNEIEYPHKTIVELFEEQVELNPSKIAIFSEDAKLTYQELNNKANQLAHYIRQKYEITSETIIALSLKEKINFIIGILATLKAGAAYAPIDVNQPINRQEFIIEDIKAKLVLTNELLSNINLLSYSADNLIRGSKPSDVAYIIYTSGTTGQPKGVMVEHKNVASLVKNVNYIEFKEEDKIIQLANIAFDASIFEIFGALLNGAQLFIPPKNLLTETSNFKTTLEKNGITILWLTKTLFDQLYIEDPSFAVGLNYLLVGGEALNRDLILKLINSPFAPKYLINGYGPTENTVFSCFYEINKESCSYLNTIPIGRPLNNRQAYILDQYQKPLPVGAVGELYVGGAGVCRGYLNKKDLTAEKFTLNPFKSGTKLYKTGDLVVCHSDGNIDYIGRNDSQVKIRGFRVELSEIEVQLLCIEGIEQAVVEVKENLGSSKYLVAYYVADQELDSDQVIKQLSAKLPEYMIPNILIYLKKLPLTASGKLDRAKLPEVSHNTIKENYQAPRNKIEAELCKLWAEALKNNQLIGIRDDYFKLGGDSIISMILVNKISKKLGLKLKIKDILNNRTIEKLYDNAIKNSLELEAIDLNSKNESELQLESSTSLLKRHDDMAIYQASSLQQGFIYHYLNQGEVDDAYIVQAVIEYQSAIDIFKYQQAWQHAQTKYPSLRLKFSWEKELVQIIDKIVSIDMCYIDISLEQNQDQKISLIQEEDRKEKFNLIKTPLFRIYLIKQKAELYSCILSFHHIILDGWSLPLLTEFVHQTYQKLLAGEVISFEIDYAYQEAQNYLESNLTESATAHNIYSEYKNFWTSYLARLYSKSDLSGLLIPQKSQVYLHQYNHILNPQGQEIFFEHDLYLKIKDLSYQAGVTANAIFQYIWHKILSIYGNSEQTIVGTIVAGRNLPINNIANSVGLYINTLPLIVEHRQEKVIEIIKDISIDINDINEYSHYNLAKLQKGADRLFESLFIYENYPVSEISNDKLKYKFVKHFEKLDYPLAAYVYEVNNKFIFRIKYAGELFADETISKLLKLAKNLIQQIVDNPTIKTHQLEFLDQEQYHKIESWNNTKAEFPDEITVNELFIKQVENKPNSIAVRYEDKILTYTELNEAANRFAHYLLQNYSIISDKLVALVLERSENMIIAILGILKAGGAYVPIDPSAPEERKKYIMDDASVVAAFSDELFSSLDLSTYPTSNPEIQVKPCSLAYVIYTSGTTGKPKGVMIEHQSLVNRLNWMNKAYPLKPQDVILQKTPYVFDVSVWELLWPICYGAIQEFAKLGGHQDPNYLVDLINHKKVTIIHFVPSMLKVFLEHLKSKETSISCLRYVFASGEELKLSHVDLFKQILPKVSLQNLYGPTECTIDVLAYSCDEKDISKAYIGKPIDNTKAYILDLNRKILPVGAIGELYISGVGVARGYINRDELTKERFIELDSERLYKTGDIVRYTTYGDIEYLGRNDFQVKIRGFRIELGEIENILGSYKDITEAVVIAKEREDGSKYLIGYYLAQETLNEDKIRKYLEAKLPEYMVPQAIIYLHEFPLTINGKLDRGALPDIQTVSSSEFTAPRNKLEMQISQIWAEVLRLGQISIRDDFFRLGGDSIISIQLVSRIRSELNIIISIKDIFKYKTIEKLCNYISQEYLDQEFILSEQGLLAGQAKLLPIQEWFFAHHHLAEHHWNQAFIIKVPSLNIEKLQSAIIRLQEFHDGFRLRFKDGKQYYDDVTKIVELKVIDKNELGVDSLTNLQNNFNLTHGPLATFAYIHGYNDHSARIFIAAHHLIIDAVSWRILLEDLEELYQQGDLGDKRTSYRQWSEFIANYGDTNEREKLYWQNILADYSDNQTEYQENYDIVEVILNEEETERLLRKVNRTYNTQINDILLTAFAYSLRCANGKLVHHIIAEGHGREELDKQIDVSRTLGWFTTLYPIRLELTESIAASIKNIKDNLRSIPNKGVGFGALFGYDIEKLPKISFNYIGNFGKTTEDDSWQIVSEDCGRAVAKLNKDNYYLNVNGMVIDGKLKFRIASKLNQRDTKKLAAEFELKLKEIISHCLAQERSYLTVSDVNYIVSEKDLNRIQRLKEIYAIYPANSLQQGFIFHSLNQGYIDDAYIVQRIWKYNATINLERLKRAWLLVQKKYSSLRIKFDWQDELLQIIQTQGELNWHYLDLSNQDPKQQEEKLFDIQQTDRKQLYNLDQGSLFRIYLIKQREDLYICIFSSHHAILDGWSIPILINFVHETYLALEKNMNFSVNQEDAYEDAQFYLFETRQKNASFWQVYLANIEEKADLSGLLRLERRSEHLSEYKHVINSQEIKIEFPPETYQKLRKIQQEESITLNAIMQYLWHKVLSIYGNSRTTIVGTTISGRNIPINNIEESVGLYANTLPLVVNHLDDKVITIIRKIVNDINEFNERGDQSLSYLQKDGKRLFDSLFAYQNFPLKQSSSIEKLKISNLVGKEKLDYPLAIVILENEDKLVFMIKYAGELFTEKTIKTLLITLQYLLEQFINNPDINSRELKYLDTPNNEKFNKTEVNHQFVEQKINSLISNNYTVNQLFEEQVTKTPNKPAIVFENNVLTFIQLNEKANQLANYLRRNYDISSDALIGLCLDRSENILVSILGVLKSGAAYVPMDKGYLNDRMKYILEDTKLQLIIVDQVNKPKLQELLDNFKVKVAIEVIDEPKHQYLSEDKNNLLNLAGTKNLAYVMYTSGTTGNPKGVMIEHRNIINYALSVIDRIGFDEFDKHLMISEYIFGLGYTSVWGSILVGGELHLVSKEAVLSPEYIINYINDKKISAIKTTSLYWKTLIDSKFDTFNEHKIKIILGGERVSCEIYDWFNNVNHKNFELYMHYGSTEVTTGCISMRIDEQTHQRFKNIFAINPVIGNAMYNTTCYVLDEDLKQLPVGAIGELHISGYNLARGYLNREKLTAEKFVDNPFTLDEKLYRSGDIVRLLECGNLEYIGRNDFQVKIRGYRIELGEIETTLLEFSSIRQVVVIACAYEESNSALKDNHYLVAYYVSDEKLQEEELFKYMEAKLPDYMVPSIFIHLEQLPLTINGKLNRKALPDPKFKGDLRALAEPRNELELAVRKIWSLILNINIEEIGINDNFFRLGGNSILAIKLASKLNQVIHANINVAVIFIHNTISKLAFYLKHDHKNQDFSQIKPQLVSNIYEQKLSFAQERLWFIDNYNQKTNIYNVPLILKLANEVSLNILEKAIKRVMGRHEILRTIIEIDNEGNSYQKVVNTNDFRIEIPNITITSDELDQHLEASVCKVFDLSHEYPIRAIIYSTNENNFLAITIHHIAFDGWSIEILLRDLTQYYNYYIAQIQNPTLELKLPELKFQYKDYALWQRQYLSGEKLEKELAFWKDKLTDYNNLNLATDKARSLNINYEGKNYYFELDEDTSIKLREIAKTNQVSLYSVLLACYYLMLRVYSNQNDITIGTPIANRNYPGTEDLIGFFVNSLALRTNINSKDTVQKFIETVGYEVIQAQLHQDLPFEKLVEELKIVRDPSKHPVFQIMFAMNNFREGINDSTLFEPYLKKGNLFNVAKFDISTVIDDGKLQLKGIFNYSTNLYDEKTIARFAKTYIHILQQIAEHKDKLFKYKIADLTYIDECEYQKIVCQFNNNLQEYPKDKTLAILFQEQVAVTPNNIALKYKDKSLTYLELNEAANQLAHYLIENYQINSDKLVALCMQCSENMIIAILAILKAGGAYVPIDPSYPEQRKDFILNDTKAAAIISDYELNKIDLSLYSKENPINYAKGSSLAYIIYTSGTTGTPKGVMIPNKNVINLLYQDALRGKFKPNKSGSLWCNIVFDVSVYEIFTILLNGVTLHVLPLELKNDVFKFIDYINVQQINYAYIPPYFLEEFELIQNSSLEFLLVGVDKIKSSLMRNILQNNPKLEVINGYGPTETTVFCTRYLCNKLDQANENIPIGTPVTNNKIYVLNEDLKPIPKGALGELYMSGEGLAIGYWNQPMLTAQRFIENPILSKTKLYKTGDLVRMLDDENIEYVGRSDLQVKIHGFRIELAEIETVISNFPGVKNSVVIVKEHEESNKSIIAFYTADDKGIEPHNIIKYLEKTLPLYMLPKKIVFLEKFPLNVNGKIDLKTLHAFEIDELNKKFKKPANEIEERLLYIWSKLLSLHEDKISTDDDFFNIGGNSILVIKLITLLRKEMLINMSVAMMFEYNSIEKIAEYIKENMNKEKGTVYDF